LINTVSLSPFDNGKKAAIGAAFFVCQNRFSYNMFRFVELYFINL